MLCVESEVCECLVGLCHLVGIFLLLEGATGGVHGIHDLAGKTLTHFYSVSWEGAVPTWTDAFEEEFAKRAGFGIKEFLPVLAGWKMPDGKGAEILKKYRSWTHK